jgi:UDP-N-acetylglucosamine 1-carboxyvinyltransferase
MEALNSAGANITESGSHKFKIEKAKNLSNMDISITPDMLEAGTLILAGVLTKGTIEVHGAIEDQLDIFYQKLIESGCNLEIKPNSCKVLAPTQDLKAVNIKTGVFPAFPTDLQAPFAVLMTQAQGISRIYETLFEGRFAFLFELEKMGAQIEMLNPHQAIIVGKTPLKGTLVASQDIRAGASMILAGLSANGTTEISNISYIFRGYDKINQKINSLGGEITLKDIS